MRNIFVGYSNANLFIEVKTTNPSRVNAVFCRGVATIFDFELDLHAVYDGADAFSHFVRIVGARSCGSITSSQIVYFSTVYHCCATVCAAKILPRQIGT